MKIKPWVVVAHLVDNNIKRAALADKAGISVGALRHALHGGDAVHETVYRIATAMNMDPEDLLQKEGG